MITIRVKENKVSQQSYSLLTSTCSTSAIETLEKGVKNVQSLQ